MSKTKDGKAIVQQLCRTKNIQFKDVDEILELYGSDLSEDEIETRTKKYSPETLKFASGLLLGLV